MEAIEFIINYSNYIETIKKVSKEEYIPILESMETWDPHDLITPETWFLDDNASLGFVYRLFIAEVKKSEKQQ